MIGDLRQANKETTKYKRQFNDLEEEMQCTIGSYKALIEQLQSGDQSQGNSLRVEIDKLQREVETIQARSNKDK